MIGVGILGISASFGFKGVVFHQDEIATIMVADGPAKIQREMAAGTVIPDQDASVRIADLIEPKKVKTVSVRPDGTLLPNDAPPQVTAAAVPVLVARAPAASIAKAATPTAARVATTFRPAALDANGNPRTSGAAKTKRAHPTAASIAKATTPTAARVATTPKPAALDANGSPQPRFSVAAKAKRMDARKQAPATAALQASPGSF
jgi:hypothetical protein